MPPLDPVPAVPDEGARMPGAAALPRAAAAWSMAPAELASGTLREPDGIAAAGMFVFSPEPMLPGPSPPPLLLGGSTLAGVAGGAVAPRTALPARWRKSFQPSC